MTLTIEPATAGWSPSNETLDRAADGHRVLGHRHRHRHPAGQAADHLRGLPAGRRQHQPQVRRHGPGPRDQPRARRGCSGGEIRLVSAPRRGQHLHALPAAGLRAAAPAPLRRPSAAGARPRRSRRRAAARNRRSTTGSTGGPTHRRPGDRSPAAAALPTDAPRLVNEVGDDRDEPPAGRRVLLIVENDVALRPVPARDGARAGLQGARHVAGRRGAGAGARVQAGGDHARHLPARHRRLARARAAEERPADAAHPGLRHLDRRCARARAGGRAPCAFVAKPIQTQGRARRRSMPTASATSCAGDEDACWCVARDAGAARRAGPAARRRRRAGRSTRRRSRDGARSASRSDRVDCMVARTATSISPARLDADAGRRPAQDRRSSVLDRRRRRHAEPSARRHGAGRHGAARVRDVRSPERLLDQARLFLHRDAVEHAGGAARGAARVCTSPTRCWRASRC